MCAMRGTAGRTQAVAIAARGSMKRIVANCLCHPIIGLLVRGVFGGQIPFGGGWIDVRNPQVDAGTAARVFWQLYERAEVDAIRRHLRPGTDIVELGASLGVVSCELARRLAPGHRLVCVEANPAMIPSIRTNLSVNVPNSNVVVVNRAISYSGEEQVRLSGSSNVAVRIAGPEREGADDIVARTTTLGELLIDYDISDYVLVADIEGAEGDLIAREKGALARCRQLIIELHDCEVDARSYEVADLAEKLVNDHGFSLRLQRGPVFVFER